MLHGDLASIVEEFRFLRSGTDGSGMKIWGESVRKGF